MSLVRKKRAGALRFVDLLIKEVRNIQNEILSVVLEPEDKAAFYRDLLLRRWYAIKDHPFNSPSAGTIYATDSSDCTIELAGGGIIHITRAAALSNQQDEIRKLKLHAFYPPSDEELTEYRKLVREHLEHEVALEAIQELKGEDAILIDGSIFGRMLHVFKILKIPGKEDFMIQYVRTLHQLLEECTRKNIILLGVAKDSRSTLLKEALLIELLAERVKNDPKIWTTVETLLMRFRRRPHDALKLLKRVSNEIGEEICRILQELLNKTPDYKMIIASKVSTGFSHPLKMEIKHVSSGFIKIVMDHKQRADLARKLAASLPEKASIEEVHEALSCISSYPPVAVLYAKFAEKDIPLRIDIIHPEVERWRIEGRVGFAAGGWESITARALALLYNLYAGLKNYNVLLTHVDQYVKMTHRVKEEYKNKIESLIKVLIQQSRGARRVSFP